MPTRPATFWVRWLASCGLPPDHIARVLGIDPADVAAVPPPSRRSSPRTHREPAHCRSGIPAARALRMHALGYSPDEIGRALRLNRADVARLVAPRRPNPERHIKGVLAQKVRRRAAAGWPPERIAVELHIDPVKVATFLAPPPPKPARERRPIDPERLVPRQPHCRRRQAGTLNRPRSPREQRRLSEWDRFDGDDHPCPCPPPIAAELAHDLVEVPVAEVPAPIAETMAEAREDWGPIQASFASGGDQGNAALTDGQAVIIRQRRAAGEARKDLAAEYSVSVATITRITRGDTYRQAQACAERVGLPPETSSAVEPQGERWEEPPGDRRRRGSD